MSETTATPDTRRRIETQVADRLRALALSIRAEGAAMQRRPRDRFTAYADEALTCAVLLETVAPVAAPDLPTPPPRIERAPSDPGSGA